MKKLMRILGVFVLSIIMAVATVACGGGSGKTDSAPDTDSGSGNTSTSDSDISYTADPYGDTDLTFEFTAGTKKNKSYWNFTYADTALVVTVRVNDTTVNRNEDATNTDGVYLYVGTSTTTADYVTDQTLKIFVSADGTVLQNKASSTTEFGNTAEGVVANCSDWSRKGTALDGYKVVLTVPYSSMGLTADDAVNSLTVLPMVADKYLNALPCALGTPSLYKCDVNKQNTFIKLTGDNSFEANPYGQSGTFGDTATEISMTNWDISQDYYEGLGVELYGQRKAVLKNATNGTNNELYFYKVQSTTMYAESSFTVTQVQNKEEYGKFGIAVVYNGTGYFFHIDAASPGNTGAVGPGSITGKNAGVVEVKSGVPDWNTHQVSYIDYNPNEPVTLGVYREEDSFKFFANGNELFSKSKAELANAKFSMAIWSYNIALELTNFRATDDQNDPMIKNNKIERVDVDYLFTGDSYVDSNFWNTWESDMRLLSGEKVNIGVGGTKVRDWMSRIGTDVKHYKAKNIVMHIGVNDIDDAGYTAQTFATYFKSYIETYRNYDENVKFYWISINPNMMFLDKQQEYVKANELVKEYAETVDYLTVIDFYSDTTTIDQTKLADGLHLSKLGYAEWNKAILGAFDVTLDEGDHLGSNEGYVMSAGWDASTDNGEEPYVVNKGADEQAIWYKATPAANFYFEAKITKQSVYSNDTYPKMGITAKTNKGEVFYYIDASATNPQTVGSVARGCYAGKTSNWGWSSSKTSNVANLTYTSGKYATLGLLKYGHTFYYYANGEFVFKLGYADTDEAAQVGLMTFNLGITAKDYKYVTDEAQLKAIVGGEIEEVKITLDDTTGSVLTREDMETNSVWTEKSSEITGSILGESFLYSDIESENFYFEANLTLTKVNGGDQWAKAGLAVQTAENTTLLFYIDANSNGTTFNDNRVYGITQRAPQTNNDWVWGYESQNGGYVFNPYKSAQEAAYLDGKYVRMAIAKYNGTYYFVINNVVYFIHSGYYGADEAATPGFGGFNVDMNVNKVVATTTDAEILANLKLFGVATDKIVVDGDISDWEADATLSAHYYETVATDGTGKSVRFYAVKTDKGVLVAGKALTANSINVRNTVEWWTNTNIEFTYGNEKIQKAVSVLRSNDTVKAFNFKCEATESYLYEVTFEMFISYDEMTYSKNDDVEILFAFRNEDNAAGMCTGDAHVWWTGKYHIYGTETYPYVITEDGISWKAGSVVTGA